MLNRKNLAKSIVQKNIYKLIIDESMSLCKSGSVDPSYKSKGTKAMNF